MDFHIFIFLKTLYTKIILMVKNNVNPSIPRRIESMKEIFEENLVTFRLLDMTCVDAIIHKLIKHIEIVNINIVVKKTLILSFKIFKIFPLMLFNSENGIDDNKSVRVISTINKYAKKVLLK